MATQSKFFKSAETVQPLNQLMSITEGAASIASAACSGLKGKKVDSPRQTITIVTACRKSTYTANPRKKITADKQ
jgi:hypothetical protein